MNQRLVNPFGAGQPRQQVPLLNTLPLALPRWSWLCPLKCVKNKQNNNKALQVLNSHFSDSGFSARAWEKKQLLLLLVP